MWPFGTGVNVVRQHLVIPLCIVGSKSAVKHSATLPWLWHPSRPLCLLISFPTAISCDSLSSLACCWTVPPLSSPSPHMHPLHPTGCCYTVPATLRLPSSHLFWARDPALPQPSLHCDTLFPSFALCPPASGGEDRITVRHGPSSGAHRTRPRSLASLSCHRFPQQTGGDRGMQELKEREMRLLLSLTSEENTSQYQRRGSFFSSN